MSLDEKQIMDNCPECKYVGTYTIHPLIGSMYKNSSKGSTHMMCKYDIQI